MKKRILMLLLGLTVFADYMQAQTRLPEGYDLNKVAEILLRIMIPISATIYLGGALLLLLRNKGNRSRRMLAYIMISWGSVYFLRAICINMNVEQGCFVVLDIYSPFILIAGNLYLILMFCYPLEIVLPGWLTWRRSGLILLPYISIVILYYAVMSFLGERPEFLTSYDQIGSSITHFNVWFRIVIILSLFLYMCVLLRIIYHYEIRYEKWRDDHFASGDPMDISWLRYYGLGLLLIGITFCAILGCGQTWCLFVHNLTAVCSISFIAYKGLFHESPYPEGFFRQTTDEVKADEVLISSINQTASDSIDLTNDSLASKMPLYIKTFQHWMDSERPYLNNDFKLTDVGRVLPLNRSYLSRVFNEGMGSNFNEVVRGYRLRDAKHLLEKYDEVPIVRVAELSGFSSASTFIRTFVQVEGITPKQYKNKCEKCTIP